MMDQFLLALPEYEFDNKVGAAFRSYTSLLELSRSPLAGSSLVAPALVLPGPTPDDYGRALRIALRWAVNRLAPAIPQYPLGQPRPFDDPTWADPQWWHYTILRHHYLEPLQADDYYEETGLRKWSRVDKLLELTGISSRDSFFDERKRAIHEAGLLLREQMIKHQADDELRRMALEELFEPLRPQAKAILAVASTFRGVFARAWLLEMLDREGGSCCDLDDLVAHRLLIEGDSGASLLLPSPLREYVHARQLPADARRRHEWAARFYAQHDQPLQLAWHLQQCGRAAESAEVLLESASALINELQSDELLELLTRFEAVQLSSAQWYSVQLLLSDLLREKGDREAAIAACRRAIRVSSNPADQARVFHRLGKLYEDHNPTRALGYYQQAYEKFDHNQLDWIDLLKDRGWLHIKCQNWASAEADLMLALSSLEVITLPDARPLYRRSADIYDALASLYRRQKRYDLAILQAQHALALREQIGDLARIADSCNNLGNLFVEMGQFDQARVLYEEALSIHRKLGNRERIANAQLNIGTTLFYVGHFEQAVEWYLESLVAYQDIGLPRGEAQAYYNIAEALASQGRLEEAARNWQNGYELSRQAGLVDQLEWFAALGAEYPALRTAAPPPRPADAGRNLGTNDISLPILTPKERQAIELVRREGYVTPKLMMEQAGMPKTTATRILTGLERRGLLVKTGQGRATRYLEPSLSCTELLSQKTAKSSTAKHPSGV